MVLLLPGEGPSRSGEVGEPCGRGAWGAGRKQGKDARREDLALGSPFFSLEEKAAGSCGQAELCGKGGWDR